jgi:protein involved in polysaccharide export with SLBB domain
MSNGSACKLERFSHTPARRKTTAFLLGLVMIWGAALQLNSQERSQGSDTSGKSQAQQSTPCSDTQTMNNVAGQTTTVSASNLNDPGSFVNQLPSCHPSVNSPSNSTTTTTAKQPAAPAAEHDSSDTVQSIQRPNPYTDTPSLHDLYTQIPSSGATLKRFGSESFLVGTGNSNELPIDLPAGPDYVLGPGDNLIVNMWGGHSERLSVTIDRQGQIALPEAGTVSLNGLTITAAQESIQKSLATQFQGEHVEISLGRLRSVRIYVVGDVQRPGAYDVSSLSTPLSALFVAGGPTSRGSLRTLKQYRGKQLVREFDLYDFLLRGVRSDIDHLLPGDTILVPPVGPQVTVEGVVHRPAIYELNGDQTLADVLELAGGVLSTGSLKQISVERVEAHQRRTMLSVSLPNDVANVRETVKAFHVQDGDRVVISQILPYNEQTVYLEGHVFRPGKYPFREGMTLNDILKSYQDVMPEPADHAEIVRLQAPDYRPHTISFSLPEVLLGNNPIPLQPFDLVRVYGRYENDSPTVTIEGEVLRPGRFPLQRGMTAADLVRQAGGFKRSAFQQEADLSSYAVVDGQTVLLNHSVVAVDRALAGDAQADILLKPEDVVSIRQLAGWVDIGSSVTLSGEVEHAGSYGIVAGERLSSVIKRAGGFLPTAYPRAAIFERVQVRELSEQARQAMIQRIETTPIEFKPGVLSTSGDDAARLQSLQSQRDQILVALRNHPANGRQVISISSDISKWENTSADIEVRAGDTLTIPKRPTFVLVSGQVYNATAISFSPDKKLGWYLQKGGGVTSSGDKKRIYVLRADGSVVAYHSDNLILELGDTIIVPEKLIGVSQTWKDIIAVAQIASSVAITGAIAGAF